MSFPMKRAWSPRERSMRITSFHFAIRSPRANDPTLSWPALVATARCEMNASSVSPLRADTTARQPAGKLFQTRARLANGRADNLANEILLRLLREIFRRRFPVHAGQHQHRQQPHGAGLEGVVRLGAARVGVGPPAGRDQPAPVERRGMMMERLEEKVVHEKREVERGVAEARHLAVEDDEAVIRDQEVLWAVIAVHQAIARGRKPVGFAPQLWSKIGMPLRRTPEIRIKPELAEGFHRIEIGGERLLAKRTIKSWIPDAPKPLLALIVPLEILGQFMRLISLSVRLFANMLAGHILILTFIGLMFILQSVYLAVAVVPIAAVFYLFEVVIVVSIQAFIFAALSAIYIGSAIEPEH